MHRTLNGWKPSATASEAFGKLFAAVVTGQRLLKDFKLNLHKRGQADRLAWMKARAAKIGFDVESVFAPEVRQAAAEFNVDLEAAVAYFLEKYVAEYAATGNPPEVAPYFGQGSAVIDFPGPDGTPIPLAVAWLTPYGSKAKAMENFEEAAFALEDKKDASVQPATIDDLAKILFMESFGMDSTEIAWEFVRMEHPESAGLTPEMREDQFGDAHAKQIDRLRQIRNRGWASVTRIVPTLSRIDD